MVRVEISDFYIKLRPQTFFKCVRFKVFFLLGKNKKIDFFVLKINFYLLLKHEYNSKI